MTYLIDYHNFKNDLNEELGRQKTQQPRMGLQFSLVLLCIPAEQVIMHKSCLTQSFFAPCFYRACPLSSHLKMHQDFSRDLLAASSMNYTTLIQFSLREQCQKYTQCCSMLVFPNIFFCYLAPDPLVFNHCVQRNYLPNLKSIENTNRCYPHLYEDALDAM